MLNLILAVEGVASIGVQFLTMRLTTPYVGSSVVPTSLIITTILLFLALGYRNGGRITKHRLKRIIFNLTFSATLILFGLSEICAYLFLSQAGLPGLLGISTFATFPIYLLFFIAPVAYLLAQIIPISIGLNESGEGANKKAGDGYFVSTMGNVIGGLFISLVVLYFFGSNIAVILIATILTLLAIFLDKNRTKSAGLYATVIAVAFFVNAVPFGGAVVDNSQYSNRTIFSTDWGDILSINGSSSSGLGKNGDYFDYIKYMRSYLKSGDRVVALGAGGFTLGKDIPGIDITYVDIDPKLQIFAEKHFLKEPVQGKFVIQDARVFAQTSKEKYDYVFADTYSSSMNVPEHIKTLEFYNDVKRLLKPKGKVVINLIHNNDYTAYDYASAKTITDSFDFCEVVNVSNKAGEDVKARYSNYIYTCHIAPNKPRAFTDKKVSLYNSPNGF